MRAFRGLCAALEHPEADARAAAATGLAFISDPRAVSALFPHAEDSAEEPGVRAQCIEGIGCQLMGTDRRRSEFRRAARRVVEWLQDPSPDVRFWSAYAAAVIGLRAARPHLEVIARNDHVLIGRNWGLCLEARWALAAIDGREEPEIGHGLLCADCATRSPS